MSRQFNVSSDEILENNKLGNPDVLKPGERLVIPNGKPPVVVASVPPAANGRTATARPDTSFRGGARFDQPAAQSAPAPSRATNQSALQSQFIAQAIEPAQKSQRETGVPASVTIAQAILESDWGQSGLAVKGQNYFGIKALRGPGPAGVINMNTGEFFNGTYTVVNDGFKKYNNMAESFADHGRFFQENKRYAAAMKSTNDARKFARLIHEAGYATDPNYSDKLIRLMEKFNLFSYDLK
ncbi:MAG: glucosaminidase domain-containing protein [Chloroflexi bacterium]|nr:glucosaminidase domain-containing protein [Chloroflexota bacterium]